MPRNLPYITSCNEDKVLSGKRDVIAARKHGLYAMFGGCFRLLVVGFLILHLHVASVLGNTVLSVETLLDQRNEVGSVQQLLAKHLLAPEKLSKNTIYKGYSQKTLWFKLSTATLKQFSYIRINNAHLDNIVLYKLRGTEVLDSLVTGDAYPFSHRELQISTFLFRIDTNYTSYVFKISTQGMLSVPIVLHTNDDILHGKHMPDFIYFGIIILALLFNLILIVRFGERLYFYYFGSILSICIIILTDWGFSFQYLWPHLPVLNKYVPILYATVIFQAIFSVKFLELKTITPVLYKIYVFLYILVSISIALSLLGHYNESIQISLYVSLIVPVLNSVSAVFALRQKMQLSTAYFLFAFLSYTIFSYIYILSFMDIVKVSWISNSSVQIANTLEIIFLFLAVIEHFRSIENSRKKADTLLLEAIKRNEEILKQQNEYLERKVLERTQEINHLNEDLVKSNSEIINANEELLLINQNLHEQKEILNKTLNKLSQTQNELIQSEKLASLGTLVAGVAHEINNPLNFIAGGLNILEKINDDTHHNQPFVKDTLQAAKQIIQQGIARSKKIVDALITYSRKEIVHTQEYDINTMMNEVLEMLASHIGNDIEVRKNMQISRRLKVYPDKIKQVFLHIIENAIFEINKGPYTCRKYIDIQTYILSDNPDFAVISIANSCSQIPDSQLAQIFDPFYTTKGPGQGTGLGLFFTYNLVQEHLGTISVKNTPDGVCFTIQLPL